MIDDGQKLMEELVNANVDVTAACWVNATEDDKWRLYVVSTAVDEKGRGRAIQAAHPALLRVSDPWLANFQFRLIGTKDPIGKSIIELQRQRPGRMSRNRVSMLGNLPVDEIYIYPPNPDWRGFSIPVYPIKGETDAFRVVFNPRQLQATRGPDGQPTRVPRSAEVEVVAGKVTKFFEAEDSNPRMTKEEYERKALERVRYEKALQGTLHGVATE